MRTSGIAWRSLGGTRNSLFAGIAAKLGQILGRVDDGGLVRLQFPVSERTEGDTRANALTGMTLIIDPADVTASLRGVRAELKRSLAALCEARFELLGPVALAPLIPVGLARRLEGMALGVGARSAAPTSGNWTRPVNRPDGTDAEFLVVRQIESRTTADILDRLGGTLFLASGQVDGKVSLSLSSWRPGGPNSERYALKALGPAGARRFRAHRHRRVVGVGCTAARSFVTHDARRTG